MYVLSEASLKKLEGVHPDMVKVFKEAVKESPYDFRITEGLRTEKYQNMLYQQGRTQPGKKVTNCDGYKSKSNHQAKDDGYGYAVDIFLCGVVAGSNYVKFNLEQGYDKEKMKEVAAHILEVARNLKVKIVWGGNWVKFKDYPHFELVK